MYVKNFKTVPYDFLSKKGIKHLIFDIDNTLAVFTEKVPSNEVVDFLNALTKKGFTISFLSNNKIERVRVFAENLDFFFIGAAGKPRRSGINKVLKFHRANKNETALIGDQVFTDVLCGNRAGVYTVLTRPLANIDEFTVKLKRFPERIVIRLLKRNVKNQRV